VNSILLTLLILGANSVHAYSSAVSTGSVAATPASAYPPPADVQACVDKARVDKMNRRKEKKAANEQFKSHKVDAKDLPLNCLTGNLENMKAALKNQIANCTQKKADNLNVQSFQFGCRKVNRQDYCLNTNTQMLMLANQSGNYSQFVHKISTQFDWYQSNGMNEDEVPDPKNKDPNYKTMKRGDTRFTGYYSPDSLEASQTKTSKYLYPLYRKPENLVHFTDNQNHCGADSATDTPFSYCLKTGNTLSPVPSRKEIATGALPDSLIFAYLKDPMGVANLQMEGSGGLKLRMADGSIKQVNALYDEHNGRPANMLGTVMKCMNADPAKYEMSEDGIRKFVADNPDRAFEIQNYNNGYVFFKPVDADKTSVLVGVDDIPVTGMHSIATDPSVIPTGSVSLYSAPLTGVSQGKCLSVSTTAIAQDVGGAITGAHIDRYMGQGKAAQAKANSADDAGQEFMAIPKDAGTPIPGCVEAMTH
jgi:membrane-bound lytic murein transglycosylase